MFDESILGIFSLMGVAICHLLLLVEIIFARSDFVCYAIARHVKRLPAGLMFRVVVFRSGRWYYPFG